VNRPAIPIALVLLALAGCGSSGIAIPKVGNRTLEQGYAFLRSKGFRVSVAYTGLWHEQLGLDSLHVIGIRQTVPAAGTHVAPGGVVTLLPYYATFGDAVTEIHPKYSRLPDFVGRSPGVAMRWADRHGYWRIHDLPQLHASTARNLLAAYLVIAQQPAARAAFPNSGWLDLTVRPRR
jgi:hypothetical protein